MTNEALIKPLLQLPEDLDASEALREGHFIPFFQPLVTLRTGQLAGFEMLARWQHPRKGLIPPAIFIPVAEQDGWIGELMRQVLRKAFAAAAVLPDPLTLACNVSPLQLRETSLPEQIQALAAEGNFPLNRLIVEITESALIDNLRSASIMVAQLKKVGCKVALDDFGTGYSSLTHLQSLPFDKLKVDRSFVSSMAEKRESRKIVSAVIGLGQSLGLTTVAEGIETQEQAEMMLWLNCDLGQGYLFGRPVPAGDLAACVSQKRERLVTRAGSAGKMIFAASLDLSPTQRLAQLQAVYDGAPVGLAFIDQNLRYININHRLALMNGARIEDHIGSSVAEMVPDLFPYIEGYIRRALAGEVLTDIEVHLPEKDQTRLISYHPVRDEAGEVIGVSIAVIDITARNRAEEALRQSEAHYRNMVDLNPQVLWIMDPKGRNLHIGPRWDRQTGKMRSNSTEHEWLRSVHPDDMQPTMRAISESRRTGSPIHVQYRALDGEWNWRWKQSHGAPRFDAAGNIVCWYGSVEDIDPPPAQDDMLLDPGSAQRARKGIRAEGQLFSLANRREQALLDLEILDSPPEAEFDDIVALASEICSTPISLISCVDSRRQWFKASVGLADTETDLDASFCRYAIAQDELFVVPDAAEDQRFKHTSLVVGHPHIRFYAGMPIHAGDGVRIGTLCVIDTIPRVLTPTQVKSITILSHQVQMMLGLRLERVRKLRELIAQPLPEPSRRLSA